MSTFKVGDWIVVVDSYQNAPSVGTEGLITYIFPGSYNRKITGEYEMRCEGMDYAPYRRVWANQITYAPDPYHIACQILGEDYFA
jgi:hypothetical protein